MKLYVALFALIVAAVLVSIADADQPLERPVFVGNEGFSSSQQETLQSDDIYFKRVAKRRARKPRNDPDARMMSFREYSEEIVTELSRTKQLLEENFDGQPFGIWLMGNIANNMLENVRAQAAIHGFSNPQVISGLRNILEILRRINIDLNDMAMARMNASTGTTPPTTRSSSSTQRPKQPSNNHSGNKRRRLHS